MSNMCDCHSCGLRSSAAPEKNKEYEKIINMLIDSGGEKQLVELIRIFTNKISTEISTSRGPNLLAYENKELARVDVITRAAEQLKSLLTSRIQDGGDTK
ncbi:Molybdopterin guanine dinucleotide synthesis protein B [Escherichia phage ZCEC13]|uniref:Molybdopterin guanine dinucleotide synthesis protein B n=1 Tax=Escherichia phage ZCEC13 TaxID=2935866 RepID=A0AAE9HHF6_9CAUD|nr:Molybdopterin guanine dinucleotide synthesis protein B [Escherichia phage ZCEC13]UPU16090.1 molybdopterin guanine dinucleotide synthesis protein B [Escherichia phage ZCEC13]